MHPAPRRLESETCTDCHASAFVRDPRTADRICTRCGVVDSRFVNGVPGTHGRASAYNHYQTPVLPRSHERDRAVRALRGRVEQTVARDDWKRARREKEVQAQAALLGLPQHVTDAAALFAEKRCRDMTWCKHRRSLNAACLVIAASQRGVYLSVPAVEAALQLSDLSRVVSRVCTATGVSVRFNVLDNLPYMLEHLGLDFCEGARVRALYASITTRLPSVGEASRLAMALYKVRMEEGGAPAEAVLERAAALTWTSPSTIRSHLGAVFN